MEYISTRNEKKKHSFKEVFLKGLADDCGLFVTKKIPTFTKDDLKSFKNLTYNELATKIILKFCSDEFDEKTIKEIINKSYKKFRVKNIVEIRKLGKINLLELFHGPTLAFKDIAMQVIGNMYEEILKKNNQKINVIVATSGDTGGAAINAIKDRDNMKIFVLHPENKISEVQRKFMTTTNSKNVFNIALSGNFDDCQKLVKLMFSDKSFCESINMSGVNSINWARIVVQIVYYFFSYYQVAKDGEKLNFSVPTGNFGDIYAGYVAKKMGLPIHKLFIATNSNDILKRVINTGVYKPTIVKHTVSPSMDIQVASNFERLIFDINSCNAKKTLSLMKDLNEKGEFKLDREQLKKINENFCSESLSEQETKSVINKMYKNQGVLIDPHTAIAIGIIDKISSKENIITLATAHPSKFSDVVNEETKVMPELPQNLKDMLSKKENFDKLDKDLEKVKSYILKRV